MKGNVQTLGVALAVMLFLVGASAVGLLIGQEKSVWAFGVLGVVLLLWVGFAIPMTFFAIIYPIAMIFGGITLGVVSFERAVVIFGAMGFMSGIFMRRFRVPHLPPMVILGVLIWLLAFCISYISIPSEPGTVRVTQAFQKAAFGWLVFVALCDERRLKKAIRVSMVVLLIASVVSLIAVLISGNMYFLRASSFGAGETLGENLFRGVARSGTGANATIAACLAMMEYRLAQEKGRPSLGWMLLVIWFISISMFALRRESLIAIIGMLILIAWYRPVKKGAAWLWVILLSFASIFTIFSYSTEWQQRIYGDTVARFKAGTDTRTNLLEFSWEATKQSPWIGYGPGSYGKTQLKFRDIVLDAEAERAPHNSFAAAAVEAGVPAFLGLSIFVLAIFFPLLRQKVQLDDPLLQSMWAMAPILFIPLFSALFFGDAITNTSIWYWLGLLAALTYLVKQRQQAA